MYAIAILSLQLIFTLDDDPLWMNRMLAYVYRVANTTNQLIQSEPLDDGILFLTGVSLLFCIAGLSAGFLLMRSGNPWLPYGVFTVAAVLIQFYLPDSARNYIVLSFFLVITIILAGRLAYIKQKIFWKKQKIREDREVSFSLVKTVTLFAILLSFFSIGLPLIVRDIHAERENEQVITQTGITTWEIIRNFFFPLRQPEGFGTTGFHSIMPLGISRSQNAEQVFSVEIPGDYAQTGIRFYWYGRIYSSYEGMYWKSDDQTYENLQYTKLNKNVDSGLVYPFLFTYDRPSDIIFHIQETEYVGRPTQIGYYRTDDEVLDIQTIMDPGFIHSGERVMVEGRINRASLDDLRAEDTDYPQWIMDRYLQLPETFPVEITELAEDISKDHSTVVDKVLSITEYLRSNYTYMDSVDIPRNAEPIEWFLFDGKTGFCNYYASAEVLLLRSLGIPARLVAGYAQGETTGGGLTFEVRVRDSHSWVEVYFPNHGWVIFEPTPSQPRMTYEEDEGSGETEIALDASAQDEAGSDDGIQYPQAGIGENMPEDIEIADQSPVDIRKTLIWISAGVLVVFLLFALIQGVFFQVEQNEFPIFLRKRLEKREIKIPKWLDSWAEFEGLGPVRKIYVKLKRYSRWILDGNDKAETPREFIQRLAVEVEIEEAQMQVFLEQFHEEVYSSAGPEDWQESEKVYRLILKGIVIKMWCNFWDSIRRIPQSKPRSS